MIQGFLLGGAVGADRSAVGQTLLAHPAIAASLSGWLVGAPLEGLWLGLTLSLLSQAHLPLGHERLRDHASVAVAIPIALGASSAPDHWGLALLLGVFWAGPLALLIQLLRELGRQIQSRAREMAERGEIPPVERWHFMLAGLHFARGIFAVMLTVILLRVVLWGWQRVGGETERQALAWLFLVAPLVGAPTLLRARGRARWFLPGVALGLVLWWARGGVG